MENPFSSMPSPVCLGIITRPRRSTRSSTSKDRAPNRSCPATRCPAGHRRRDRRGPALGGKQDQDPDRWRQITARFMRQDYFEYIPQFTLMVYGNHKPGLKSVDDAMRRRLKLIPFAVKIPDADRDNELGEKLKSEWSGILSWMIEGCLMWQREGLVALKWWKPPRKTILVPRMPSAGGLRSAVNGPRSGPQVPGCLGPGRDGPKCPVSLSGRPNVSPNYWKVGDFGRKKANTPGGSPGSN